MTFVAFLCGLLYGALFHYNWQRASKRARHQRMASRLNEFLAGCKHDPADLHWQAATKLCQCEGDPSPCGDYCQDAAARTMPGPWRGDDESPPWTPRDGWAGADSLQFGSTAGHMDG